MKDQTKTAPPTGPDEAGYGVSGAGQVDDTAKQQAPPLRPLPDDGGTVRNPGPKTLHNSDVSGARVNVPDIRVVGNGDSWQLLCKASSQREGWMKSTKALDVGHGCVVQVTTQQENGDGTYAVAEAIVFVPFVHIEADVNGGRKLVRNP